MVTIKPKNSEELKKKLRDNDPPVAPNPKADIYPSVNNMLMSVTNETIKNNKLVCKAFSMYNS